MKQLIKNEYINLDDMKLFKVMETSFENFDRSVRSYLSKTFNSLGLDYTPNQIFGVVYDGIKGIIQNVMFYIEDALTEQNIYTAIRKKSFYSLARQSGYEPFYGSAATGTIIANAKLTGSEPGKTSSKIYIKDNTILQNGLTGLQYTVMLGVSEYVIDVSKPLTTHQFKIVQGSYNSADFIAKGSLFETFNVDTVNMFDKEYTKVYVNGELWEQAATLYDMNESDKQYMINTGFDNTFDVTFGNGVHGKKLNSGDNISIQYFTHNGEHGNITNNAENTFKFISPCYNAYGNTVNGNEYITLSMNSLISGGTNEDSIDLVKKMIGYNSRSLVLANEDNFKMFLKRFSFIGQTSVYASKGSMDVTASCLSSKKNELTSPEEYLDLEEEDLLLTSEQKDIILTTLNNSNKTFLGASFKLEDPIINRYAMICYVKADNAFNKEAIKSSIRNSLASYFMALPENTKFIAKSDLIKTVIDNNTNIEAFDFDFISEKNEDAYRAGFYNEYELRQVNGILTYKPIKYAYDKVNTPGLDAYGNIEIKSNIEIPLLHGGFNYYPNKTANDKITSVRVESVDVLFI